MYVYIYVYTYTQMYVYIYIHLLHLLLLKDLQKYIIYITETLIMLPHHLGIWQNEQEKINLSLLQLKDIFFLFESLHVS